MININKVTILGNITKDPELKVLPSGNKVCSFSVATNRSFKDAAGQRKDSVEFHNIVVFGKQAENTSTYMKKGSQILIDGRLQTRSWDGQDGKKIYRTEIIADDVKFGSSPQPTTAAAPVKEKSFDEQVDEISYPDDAVNLEDIPF